MWLRHRLLLVRNLAIAFINGLLTLIILLIAPLGLLAVIVNTFFVTVASFIVGIAGDGVIRWLLRKSDLYFLFSPSNQGKMGSLNRRDSIERINRD
jgi:hypothetical protein